MSIKSKWIGLEEYGLRLFLIKNRFFVTGSGIEENTNKLLALGFREVPKNSLKEGAKSYWVAQSESGFLRRIVAAFPDYTVQMLPPEGINPTILVNRNQELKGDNYDTQQSRQRASNTRQPVAETASGNPYVSNDGSASVLGGASTSDDPRDQSGANGFDGRGADVSGLAQQNAEPLRGSGANVSRTMETSESVGGFGKPSGSGELAQSGENGEPRSMPIGAGAKSGADNADGAGSRLLLVQADLDRIKNTMDRRVLLTEQLRNDTVSLASNVKQAIEENNYARHAELRTAYEKLEGRESTLTLANLFYVADKKDGVIEVVESLGDADITVGRARGALEGAGYGWVAQYIKPILSFSDDDTKEVITIDRVKQILVDRFAVESGIADSADARAADDAELQSKIGRASLLSDLMSLGRAEQSAKVEAVDTAVEGEQKSIDLIGMEAVFSSYKEEVNRYKQLVDSFDQRAAEILKSKDYADAERLIAEFEALDISDPFIVLSDKFAERTGKDGVLAVFDNFKGAGTTIEKAREVFSDTPYIDLFERTAQGYTLIPTTEQVSVERVRTWIIEQIAMELPSEDYAAYKDAFESTLQQRDKTSLLVNEIKKEVAALEASIPSDNESAESSVVTDKKDMTVDFQIFDKANKARSVAISDVVLRVDRLKDEVDGALESKDYSMVLEFDDLHSQLVRDHNQLKIENQFFLVANGEGVTKVFDSFDANQDISFDDARAAFDAEGYGELCNSAIEMHKLFNIAPVSISFDDLKSRIVDRVIAMSGFDDTTYEAESDESNYYDSLEDLGVIESNINVLKEAAIALGVEKVDAADDVDQEQEVSQLEHASNFTLAEYAKLATVTKLENHGRKWAVSYGSDSGFSDAEDAAGAIADYHRNAVTNALYYNSPVNSNILKLTLPSDEVLAEYPDLVERFSSAFIVNRPEAKAKVDGFVQAYNVYGYDILAFNAEDQSGKIIKKYILQSEENRLSAKQGVYDLDGSDVTNIFGVAVGEALSQYAKRNRGLENAAEEKTGKFDADNENLVSDGDEPNVGDGSVLTGVDDSATNENEVDQEQDNAIEKTDNLSVVARMAALGYSINPDTLNPFENISASHRELLSSTGVIIASKELYQGFDTVITGEENKTLVMNAPRPLLGDIDINGEFFHGRFYALVDTASPDVDFKIKNNVSMDAKLPIYMDANTRIAFELQRNRYASKYLEMLESGEISIEDLGDQVIKNREYTIDTLEAELNEFKASFTSVDIELGDSNDELSDDIDLDSKTDEAPAFFADDDDALVREWSGLTLEDLKRAEAIKGPFRNGVKTLLLAENGMPFADMNEISRSSLLSFTGWGGIHETFRMDQRQTYAGRAVSTELGMSEADFHDAVVMNRLESYYTPASIIESMWKAVQQAGVPASGKYLEPSVGSGHFFVGAPPDVQSSATLIGVDCDPIAVRFAKAAAPDARIIESRYENVILDNTFDAVIGNVPFGSTKISDSRYPSAMYIHDYFIKRSLSHLKDGGLMAVITTAGTMDKADNTIRSEIMETADLVAAVRLPSDVFARDNAKVVTDILVFQKRPDGTQPAYDFTSTSMLDVEGEQFRVNDFFLNNPQYVLGNVTTTTSQFGPKMDVSGQLDGIGERLDEALSAQIPVSIYKKSDWKKSAKADDDDIVAAWDESAYAIDADQVTSRMIGEITIIDGKLVEIAGTRQEFDSEGVFVGESVLVADVSTNKKKGDILLDYVPLRDAAVALSVAQLNGDDDKIKQAQENTLKLYQGFVKKHGPVNDRKVFLAVGDDPRSSEVFALEKYDQDKGVVVSLAQTLYEKVVGSNARAKVETAEDAYYVCIDHKGSIDLDYMAEISGLEKDAIRDDLLGHLIFLNPKTNQIETKSAYLSGNVVRKLEEAEQAALSDSQTFAANIEALKSVRPLLLPFEDISINLGASWIPVDDIRQFIADMCNKSNVTTREISVTRDKDTGVWKVDALASFEKNNEIVMRSRFGTERAKFTKLLEMALNGKKPSHYVKNPDNSSSLDYEATMASRAKQDDIKEAFENWVGATNERKERFTEIYNDKINVICPPKADGSRITFPGMAASWKPRAHQSDVVAMGLMGYNVMAAHPVGAGKTFEMVALAVKLKQVGMSSKPMIAVPNHMLAQMSREAKEIFPSAKILMVTNDDLSFKNRKRFFAVARNNDWDLIVCTHSMLDRLQAPFDIKMENIRNEIDIAQRQLDGADSNQQKRNLINKINTLHSKSSKMVADHEKSLTDPKKAPMLIEDIGVDTILVDEAHLYKNLFLNTGMQVLGISTDGSQRATNLSELSQYLRNMHGKCAGLHFFTGTPIANSVAELYVHNRFLRPDILESMEINTFDQWAMNFGKTVDKAEVLADGGSIGIRTRFSEFQNLPELIKMFRTFADVRTLAELNLPTPKLNSNTVIVEQTQLGKDHMTHLGIRAVATRKKGSDKSVDNILNIATDGRKAALDLQMIDHRLPDDASNKLSEVADNIIMEWDKTHEQKGAQLVFMDLGTPSKNVVGDDKRFSAYDKLKDILVQRGMPREQIAYIHDAKNDAAKDEIFKAVRSGDIRVLIGSTLKMGVGTNVQERLCALHNVDCPWRPDQLEQRIGRIMRQGNLFFDEVTEHRYVTKDSIELFMYQKLETKDKFIKQAMASPDLADRVMTEEVDAGYGDVMASATGEPRIKEKFEVDAEVERLERRKRTWTREQAYARDRLNEMKRDISKLESHIQSYKAVQKALPKSTYKAITVRGSVFGVQEGDATWLSATEAGIALKTRIDSVTATISRSNERSLPLKANIGEIELMIERNGLNQDVIFADIDGRSVPDFSIKEHKNPQQLGRSVRSLYNAAGVIKNNTDQIKTIEDNISRTPAIETEWPLAAEFEKLCETKRELDSWFVKQDFDSRFEGISDPFEAKLNQYIIEWERKKVMDSEDDMEAFNGSDLEDDSEQFESSSNDNAMAGFLNDDVAAIYDADNMLESGDEQRLSASKGLSMR